MQKHVHLYVLVLIVATLANAATFVMTYDKRNVFRHTFTRLFIKDKSPQKTVSPAPKTNWTGYQQNKTINERCHTLATSHAQGANAVLYGAGVAGSRRKRQMV